MVYYFLYEHQSHSKYWVKLKDKTINNSNLDEKLKNNETLEFDLPIDITEKSWQKSKKLDLLLINGLLNGFLVSQKFYDIFHEKLLDQILFYPAVIKTLWGDDNFYYMHISPKDFFIFDPYKSLWDQTDHLTPRMTMFHSPYQLEKIYQKNPGNLIFQDIFSLKFYVSQDFYDIAQKYKLKLRMENVFFVGEQFAYGGRDEYSQGRNYGFRILESLEKEGINSQLLSRKNYGNFVDRYILSIEDFKRDTKDPTKIQILLISLNLKDDTSPFKNILKGSLSFRDIQFLEGAHSPFFDIIIDEEGELIDLGFSVFNNQLAMFSTIYDEEELDGYYKQALFDFTSCQLKNLDTNEVHELIKEDFDYKKQ